MLETIIKIGNTAYIISSIDYTIYVMKKDGRKFKVKCDSEIDAYKTILALYSESVLLNNWYNEN